MSRKPRFYLPNVPAHVIQRGNNRQAVFFAESDYLAYLTWLKEGAQAYGCSIHAYVMMTNHVHVLVTPVSRNAISHMIQYVGRHYVTYVNRHYRRSGTLWEGRHKGCVVAQDAYLLACSRYIELNPVRAGMVTAPDEYRWSSYRANAFGDSDVVVTPHSVYSALGRNCTQRQYVYRQLFRRVLAAEQVREIRAAVQTGTPLGNDHFRKQIEVMLQCKVGQARRGRPIKSSPTEPD